MISKELFSEVLGDTIKEHDRAFVEVVDSVKSGKDIHINYKRKDGIIALYIINIYELMHLMKEWAWSQKYLLESGVTDTPFCSITNTNEEDTYNNYLPDERTIADTEPEAIFKACQWILNNKDML